MTIATKIIKYLGINLTKEVTDLYSENFRTLKKEMKIHISGKNIPYSWIGRINIIKISILPKAIYRFKAILMQTPMVHCTYLEPIFQIYIWNQIIDLK